MYLVVTLTAIVHWNSISKCTYVIVDFALGYFVERSAHIEGIFPNYIYLYICAAFKQWNFMELKQCFSEKKPFKTMFTLPLLNNCRNHNIHRLCVL